MPILDGTTVYLISQFDARVLLEFAPSPATTDPFLNTPTTPLYDAETRTVSVYVPIYRSSQFWIAYSSAPPDPATSPDEHFHYYKLRINGRDIVSWGVGRADAYSGKTMFSLYQGYVKDRKGKVRECTEVRTLHWGRAKNEREQECLEDDIEIRMYRAKARKRVEPEMQMFKDTAAAALDFHKSGDKKEKKEAERPATVGLFNAGPLMYGQPKKFFKYALLDPVDKPYMTFRYLYRTLPTLSKLGVIALDELERQVAESVAASPFRGELQKRTGPRMVPSVSLRSIVSIRSDTGLQYDPHDPMPEVASPSPLRIPAFTTMNPSMASLAELNVSADDLSQQTRDSLSSSEGEDDEKDFKPRPLKPKNSLYLNRNSPLRVSPTKRTALYNTKPSVENLVSKTPSFPPSHPNTSFLQRARQLVTNQIPLLRPRPSQEQVFRSAVSSLLDQPQPALRPRTPEPGDTSPTPPSRRHRLFSRTSSETLRGVMKEIEHPKRSASSMSSRSEVSAQSVMGTAWLNDIFHKAKKRAEERARRENEDAGQSLEKHDRELSGEDEPVQEPVEESVKAVRSSKSLDHVRSMSALNDAVNSAKGRRERKLV